MNTVTQWIHEYKENGGQDSEVFLDSFSRFVLVEVIRNRRNDGLRAKIETQAICSDAIMVLLERLRNPAEQDELQNRLDVQRFLKGVVKNCLNAEIRKHATQKRDFRRQQNLESGSREISTQDSHSEEIIFFDSFQEFLRNEEEMNIQILMARLEGLENAEIAERIGRSKRTVELRIADLESRFQVFYATQ